MTMKQKCVKCGRTVVLTTGLLDYPNGYVCPDCRTASRPINERVSFDDRADETPLKEGELRECS